MSGSLDGVFAKIRRAETHLADLDTLTRHTGRACRDAVTSEYDHQRSHHVFRIGAVPAIDPEFSLILGDAVHNLRAALDHLAWQLVLATGTKGPSDETAFPILTVPPTPSRWGRHRPQIAPGVSDAVRERLDLIQPYQRTYPANHPLTILRELDNGDKHRELVVVVVGSRGVGWFGEVELIDFNPGPYEPGDEIARFAGEPDAYFNPGFTFEECFDEPATRAVGVSFGALNLLRLQTLGYFRDEILPRFSEFFD